MTAEGLSFVALLIGAPLNWIVTGILVAAAIEKPRIRFLSFVSGFTLVIAIVLTTYVAAILNAAVGYPVPRELAVFLLRMIVFALALIPLWFLFLYVTGRFRDDAS